MTTMRGQTFFHVDEPFFVEDCIDCGILFAMTLTFKDQRYQDGKTFHCPNGHQMHYTRKKDREQELASQVARLEARQTHLEDQGRAAAVEAERLRGQILRDRHRVANGVCPCCNRTFQQVLRHMRSQHPDYDLTKVEGVGNTVRFPCECGRCFDTIRGLHIHQGRRRRDDWWQSELRWGRHLTRVEV